MPLGVIMVDHDSDLEQVRRHINRMQEENQHSTPLSPEWCFVDCEWIVDSEHTVCSAAEHHRPPAALLLFSSASVSIILLLTY